MRGNLMKTVLAETIRQMQSFDQIRESMALALWPQAVGKEAAEATEADSVRDGVLFVRTKSSTWSHELNMHKSHLLLSLNRLIGEKVITDIRFQATGLKKKPEVVEEEIPSPETLQAVALTKAEKIELRSRLQDLIEIPDDHVRETIAIRLTLDAKLRHWRLEKGWKVCPRCDTLHKTTYVLCPFCRLKRR